MRSYSHLSDDERDQIGILRAAGRSMGAIARALGRAKTTISRELQRNALPSGGYSPLHAAGAYQLRRRREAILEREAALRLFVGDRLAEGWTPEQISGWLKSGNEPRLRAIGCETIYAFIYRTGQKAEALWRYLIPFPGDQLALAIDGHQWNPALPFRVWRSFESWAHCWEMMASRVSRSGMCLLTIGSSTVCQRCSAGWSSGV